MTMQGITLDLDLFAERDGRGIKRARKTLLWFLTALAETNLLYLTDHPETPFLYTSGVLYEVEHGTEIWKTIPRILEDGFGDCEDLACWRIAELRLKNVKARPYIKWQERGSQTSRYHAVLRWPDGRIEDPSRSLGMHGHPITRAPVWIEP